MTAVRIEAGEESLSGNADPADAPWSHTDMLLAAVVDAIHSLQWTYISAHSKRPAKQPDPLRRPGAGSAPEKGKGTLSAAQYRMLTGEAPPLYLIQGGG
jgi:hypothetical protein